MAIRKEAGVLVARIVAVDEVGTKDDCRVCRKVDSGAHVHPGHEDEALAWIEAVRNGCGDCPVECLEGLHSNGGEEATRVPEVVCGCGVGDTRPSGYLAQAEAGWAEFADEAYRRVLERSVQIPSVIGLGGFAHQRMVPLNLTL